MCACRYFETEEYAGLPGRWWFGGGSDITPSYVIPEDIAHFHGTYKVASSCFLSPFLGLALKSCEPSTTAARRQLVVVLRRPRLMPAEDAGPETKAFHGRIYT